jgi:hypothetical protein
MKILSNKVERVGENDQKYRSARMEKEPIKGGERAKETERKDRIR